MSIAEKLTTIAENMQGVYDKGYADGQVQGSGDEYYDIMWDNLQSYGEQTDYQQRFRGWYNLKKTFKPKYDIYPTNVSYLFYSTSVNGGETYEDMAISLPEVSKEQGITIDFSRCTTFGYAFSYAQIKDTGYIDMRAGSSVGTMFLGSQQVKTTHLRIKDDGSQNLNGSFNYCYGMENLTIEGLIANNFSVQWSSKLSKASFYSIMGVLSDTVTGQTFSVSKNAVNKAFETSEGANDGSTSDEWNTLVATKPNWTITLA